MILRALVLRPAQRRPLRLLLTIVGVAAGVAAVVATIAANRAAVWAMREGVVEVAGGEVLEITAPGGVPTARLAALRRLASHARLAPVIEEAALLPELRETVKVLGVDLLTEVGLANLPPLAGGQPQWESVLRGDGVLVPSALAERLSLQVGDRLLLAARSRTVQLIAAGVVAPQRLASAWNHVIVMDIAAAQELFGRHGYVDALQLRPRPGVTLEQLRDRVVSENLLPPPLALATPGQRAEGGQRMLRALEFNLAALSGISLLVGAVLVATTLATSVVQRRRVIALLRSLGAGRGQIARAVLVEAALIGLAGGVAGVLGGGLAARAALASVRATVASAVQSAVPTTAIDIDPPLAVTGVLLGVVVSLAAAALPLLEARATPPLQGLRGEPPVLLPARARRRSALLGLALLAIGAALARLPAVGGLPIPALAGSLAILAALLATAGLAVDTFARLEALPGLRRAGVLLRLAGAALAAGRRRAAWAAGAVGVAIALAVAIATMVSSFRATVIHWAEQGLRSDLWVRPAAVAGVQVGRLHPDVVECAIQLFGNEAVDPFHVATVPLHGETITLGAGALEVVARHGGVPFRSGEDARAVFAEVLRRRGAVINEPAALRFGLAEGDVLRLPTPKGVLERPIVGVFYDYSRSQGMVVIDRADFLAHFPDIGAQELAVFLPPHADPAEARQRLLAALSGRFLVEVFLNRELRAEVIAVFDRTFAITTALQLVAVGVAVVAVATVLLALLAERARDLALLRALGASRTQVARVVLVQAALLGVIGAAGGIAAGLAIGLILVKVVNVQSFAWTLRLLPPWGSVLSTAAWVALGCLVAGAVPAAGALRVAPAEVLREE